MNVRDMKANEAAAVLGVMRDAFAALDGLIEPPSGVHTETVQSVLAKTTRGTILVAEISSVLAGCVYVHAEPDHLYLGRLAVLPVMQHRGIGQALVTAAKARARALGLSRVQLNVRKQLDANRRFFERCGFRFEAYGTHEGFSMPTFLKMVCDL